MNSLMQHHILFQTGTQLNSDSTFAYVPQVNYIGTRNFFDEWCKFNGVTGEKENCEYLMRNSTSNGTRITESCLKDIQSIAKAEIKYIKLRKKLGKQHDIALRIRCLKLRESLHRRCS